MTVVTLDRMNFQVRDDKDLVGIQDGRYEAEETDLIKSLLRTSDVALDIGANIGYFTILMSKRCREVYAFEPDESNVNLLLKNMNLNNATNVKVIDQAVCEYRGLINLYPSDVNHGMHRTYPSKWCRSDYSAVRCVNIDWLRLPKVDFVKMDVEGTEYKALLGMKTTIEKYQPVILMEFHPPSIREAGIDPYDIYVFLRNRGYKIMLVPETEPIGYEDLIYKTNDTAGGQNILCMQL